MASSGTTKFDPSDAAACVAVEVLSVQPPEGPVKYLRIEKYVNGPVNPHYRVAPEDLEYLLKILEQRGVSVVRS